MTENGNFPAHGGGAAKKRIGGKGQTLASVPVRRYRRRRDESGGGDEGASAPVWLVTFTDIMGLMLTFFVLMFAMRSPEPRTFETLVTGLQNQVFKILDTREKTGPFDTIDLGRVDFNRALDLDYLEALVRERVSERADVLKDAVLVPQSGSLIVSLPQDIVFDPGKDVVSDGGKATLGALAGILVRVRNRIEIIGHADIRPIPANDKAYESNWDLSLARAVAAAEVLRVQGYERPVVVRGLGDALYHALPGGLPESFRDSISRRVDIVIMSDDGSRRQFLDLGTD